MKAFVILIIIIVLAGLAAIVTKPSDEQCIELMKSKINTEVGKTSSDPLVTGLGSVLVDMGVKKTLFRIEDKIFYKNIYFIIGGQQVGTALFGTVIISSNKD